MEKKQPIFLQCTHCGNLVMQLEDAGVPILCCGEPMKRIEPNTTEAATEKHLPVVIKDGQVIQVKVGSQGHPMGEEHSIRFIWLETKCGGILHNLTPDAAPEAQFVLAAGETPIAAYAYCNLHGIWKTPL